MMVELVTVALVTVAVGMVALLDPPATWVLVAR
jgi:hypothetical protein